VAGSAKTERTVFVRDRVLLRQNFGKYTNPGWRPATENEVTRELWTEPSQEGAINIGNIVGIQEKRLELGTGPARSINPRCRVLIQKGANSTKLTEFIFWN
jgi:hypothetical protein